MTSMGRITAACTIAGIVLAGAPVRGGAQGDTTWTRVTYLSGSSVYIDAGSNAGLREGSRVDVVRMGHRVGGLTVAFVSSTRASCSVADGDVPAVGDSVRFVRMRAANPASSATIAGRAARPAPGSGLRGRLGLRYLSVESSGGLAPTTQPALDIRLDGQHLGGTPLGVAVDVRAQTTSSLAGGTRGASLTRAYQAALLWAPAGTGYSASIGRQFASALSTIGMFDGIALESSGARVNYGMLAGTQPDASTLGWSPAVRQYGGFVQAHNRSGATTLWTATLGGVGAYDGSSIDREFAYLRLTYTGPRLSLFAAQELDVNRGWRAAAEGSATTPTSTFVLGQVAVADWLSLNAGFDNRRNVRLYRDFVNAETAFDDTFREGAWGGVAISALGHLRVASDVRSARGGTGGDTRSVTHAVSLTRLPVLGLGVRARSTEFTGAMAAGSLRSASVELSPVGAVHAEFTAGRRETDAVADASVPTRLDWTSLDVDVSIGRSVYLLLAVTREVSGLDRVTQSYAALSWRF